jgi:hypothetical protein
MTNGFSGSDCDVAVKQAIYQPLRDAQAALYFRQINGFWTPCAETAPGATRMTMMPDFGDDAGIPEVPKGKLRVSPVTAKHFFDILAHCKPTVSQNDLVAFEEWTLEFGEDGNEGSKTGKAKKGAQGDGGEGKSEGDAAHMAPTPTPMPIPMESAPATPAVRSVMSVGESGHVQDASRVAAVSASVRNNSACIVDEWRAGRWLLWMAGVDGVLQFF